MHTQTFTKASPNKAEPAAGRDEIPILADARRRAQQDELNYAGTIEPFSAWALFVAGNAVIVDVRTKEELHFVGQVPDALHVAWATGTAMTRNPRFVREVEAKVPKDKVVLLLCRSGKRSALAAEALSKAGYGSAFNIADGFEGEIDEKQQRGRQGGWRLAGLPWVQN